LKGEAANCGDELWVKFRYETRIVVAIYRQNVAVVICSSDNRLDILERVLPSLFKFWPDCPYPIYVGLNTKRELAPNIRTLLAQPTEWRKECLEQIAQITESHVIVVLDDFLFQRPVDQRRIEMLVDVALHSDISYLRLVPLGKSLLKRLDGLIRTRNREGIEVINEDRPFYSGLQIALWNRAHFMSLLQLQGTIWDFEHQKVLGVAHYVVTDGPAVHYCHLVDKGRWLPYAQSLLTRAGLSTDLGARQVWPRWVYMRLALDRVRLLVLGNAIN
jgi:hypothetical protein